MTLPVSDVVSVQVFVSPTPAQAPGFGTALILGESAVLPLEQRVKTYASLTAITADGFSTSSNEYLKAQAHFGQLPSPATVKIGARYTTAQAGKLRGSASVSANFASYTGITNGGFDVTVNSTLIQVTALNLSGAASMAAIATLIQTKLNAGLAGTTCTWTGSYFLITSPTTGTSSLVTYAAAPTGAGGPTDVSATLGFTLASGALAVNGIAAESMTDSLNASLNFDAGWYGLLVTTDSTTQDIKDAGAFAQANKRLFGYETNDPNCLITGNTTNLGYFFQQLSYDYVFGIYSGSPNAAASAMARLFVTDFSQPNSTITLKFKQLPGIGADNLTEAQRLAIEGYNLNWYTNVAGLIMLANGIAANGRFLDEVQGLDWLSANCAFAIFNTLASFGKVPLTNTGAAMLVQALTGVLKQGVANGLLAPGVWNGQNLGEVKTGDFLQNGFYIYVPPVSTMSIADRGARKSPPLTVIMCGAGAIHSANVQMTFQR